MKPGKSVLVLEDEVLIAFDLAAIIEAEGHEVMGPCHRVRDALAALEACVPDVAILDVNLGQETSEPVAGKLTELGVPFAFATGYSSGKAEVLARFPRITCLSKPIQPEALSRLIAEQVDASDA